MGFTVCHTAGIREKYTPMFAFMIREGVGRNTDTLHRIMHRAVYVTGMFYVNMIPRLKLSLVLTAQMKI
jgi:hypothetical protein